MSELTVHIKQPLESNSTARLSQGWVKLWGYWCSLSVSAVMWKDQMPSKFQTSLMFCQDSDTHSTIHLYGRYLFDSFSAAHNICLSRVYHIDSNPSSVNDSGADFAKAFTVRDLVLLYLLSDIEGKHLKLLPISKSVSINSVFWILNFFFKNPLKQYFPQQFQQDSKPRV